MSKGQVDVSSLGIDVVEEEDAAGQELLVRPFDLRVQLVGQRVVLLSVPESGAFEAQELREEDVPSFWESASSCDWSSIDSEVEVALAFVRPV